MTSTGIILMDGVRVGRLCKQNGRWYVMENTEFGYRHSFKSKPAAMAAVRRWWRV